MLSLYPSSPRFWDSSGMSHLVLWRVAVQIEYCDHYHSDCAFFWVLFVLGPIKAVAHRRHVPLYLGQHVGILSRFSFSLPHRRFWVPPSFMAAWNSSCLGGKPGCPSIPFASELIIHAFLQTASSSQKLLFWRRRRRRPRAPAPAASIPPAAKWTTTSTPAAPPCGAALSFAGRRAHKRKVDLDRLV